MDLNPKIIDNLGRELYTFGGESAYATGTYRGWCWSLEWFIGQRSTEPMLAIWPLLSERETCGAWGICLSSAGKFLTPEGYLTPATREEAKTVMREQFGRPALGVELDSLCDVILHKLPEVILMPPAPRQQRLDAKRAPLLEIERHENGRKVAEVTL